MNNYLKNAWTTSRRVNFLWGGQFQLEIWGESSIMKLATSPCLKIFVLLSFSKPVISFDNRLETVRLSSQG